MKPRRMGRNREDEIMVDASEYFPTDEQVESRAVAHAFGLLAAVGDAKEAKVRLQKIIDATADYTAQRSAAEKIAAEADTKRAAAEQAESELAEKTARSKPGSTGPRSRTANAKAGYSRTRGFTPSATPISKLGKSTWPAASPRTRALSGN
jgi:hypothetical protein